MEELKNKELQVKSNSLLEETKSLVVKKNEKYFLHGEEQRQLAAIYLKEASSLEKMIKDHYKPIEAAHRETGKVIKATKESQLVEVTLAKRILSQGIGEFDAEIRRQKEKEAEEKRKQIEAERLKEAERLEAEGKTEEAQDILEAPEPIVITEQPKKLEDIRQVKYIKSELENDEECVRFIVQKINEGNPEFYRFLTTKMSEVRQFIKFHEGQFKFPGVKTWEEYQAQSTGR